MANLPADSLTGHRAYSRIPDRPRHVSETLWRWCRSQDRLDVADLDVLPIERGSEEIGQLVGKVAFRLHSAARLHALEASVHELRQRLSAFEGRISRFGQIPVTVTIETLEPEPFHLKRPIRVLIQPSGEEYVASFLDAGISTSGISQQNVLENLKDLLIDMFLDLNEEPAERLGPIPQRQLAILSSLIVPR